MKNRWNLLKKKYGQWKTLNLRATGLGRDPFTGYIVADDEWWVKQNKTMPGCICFKTVPLEHEEQIRIMFDAVVVTNETSYVPTTGGSSSHNEGDANVNADFDNPAPLNADRRAKKGLLLPLPRREKKKKTFRDQCMKRLVDAYEIRAQSSNFSATSQVVDHVRDEIGSMMDQVIKDGADEKSDEHFYATQLLQKKENRDIFITFKTASGRLNWLKKAWEARKKHWSLM